MQNFFITLRDPFGANPCTLTPQLLAIGDCLVCEGREFALAQDFSPALRRQECQDGFGGRPSM
jgi:hypothetical protein